MSQAALEKLAQTLRDEGGKAAAVSAVIDGIVEELVEAGMKKMVAPDS